MNDMKEEDLDFIFFDVDDTLFDQQKSHQIALQEIKGRYDIFERFDMEQIIRAFEEADDEAVDEFRNGEAMDDLRWNRSERFLKKLGVDNDFTKTFHDEFYRIYPTIPVEIEGAEEVIKELGSKYELGVLSNSTEEIQMKKLQALNLTHYFEEFIFSEEAGSRKPDKEIFLHSIDIVDRSSDRCLYVGNSFRIDVEGAQKVGMRTCWLNRHDEKKKGGPEPDIEIKELRNLLEILA